MGDILFLSQRIPWPPDKGDKIRSWRALEHLAGKAPVHLGTFIDDPDDLRHIPIMENLCASVHIARLHPLAARLRSLRALLTGDPLSLPYFQDKGLATWVETTLRENNIDTVFIFSSAMAQYVLQLPMKPAHILMDFVDVDSEKFHQYAHEGGLLSRLVYGREAGKLRDFDRKVSSYCDASFFVSETEADLFRRISPETADKIFGLSNGIDTDYFDPAEVKTDRGDHPEFGTGLNLVFTGRMDYKPNVDAVCWFARNVLPQIVETDPQARFIIAGAAPAPDVVALSSHPAVRVTGRVEDMRPFLVHADIAVAPMSIGRGIQNKVLEAAAMARPVVTTPQGLAGIDLEPGVHVRVAEGSQEFARAILELKDAPEARAMGQRARQELIEHYAWPARMAGLDRFLGGT